MKNKVIKVISLLTAIVTLFSFAACGGDNGGETTTNAPGTTLSADATTDSNVQNAEGEADPSATEGNSEGESEATSGDDKTTTNPGDKTTENNETTNNNKTTNNNGTTKPTSNNTTKPSTTAAKKYTNAEIVKICTDAINKAKKESPGYTKAKYQKLEGDRSAVPAFYNALFGFFEEESTKTYKKGESDETNYGVDGWVATKVTDPTSIKMEIKNGKYIINYKFGNETNPADLNSRYGRTMDIMTPAEVKKKSIGLISDVSMNYHDGFLTAEIDIKTGRLTYMKMGSHVDADVNKNGKRPFTVKDIVSIATYTNFVW